jgi:hypothetical protein
MHVELNARRLELWVRRAGIVLFAAFLAAGLANVFGQAASTSRVSSPTADLVLGAPDAVRSGLIYEVQFTVVAHRALQHPALVLEPGWFDGSTCVVGLLTLKTTEVVPACRSSLRGVSVPP